MALSAIFPIGKPQVNGMKSRERLPAGYAYLLWSALEPHRLASQVQQALSNPKTVRYLSPISLWELTVLVEVALNWKVVHELRFILPNHKDPADRFLVATAIAYDLTLLTADQRLLNVPGMKVLANT